MPDLSGTITTSSTPTIRLANINVILKGEGLFLVSQTNFLGEYKFPDVTVGSYLLSAHNPITQNYREKKIKISDTSNEADLTIGSEDPASYKPLKYFQYIFLAVLGAGFLFFIFSGLWNFDLKTLKDLETARGLITYLIALTAVAMAAILMFASIMIGGVDLDKRFVLGKEILTLLIGILGTIIGFYYGSGSSEQSKTSSTVDSVKVENVLFAPKPVVGKQNLTFSLNGGHPPFVYSIKFKSKELANGITNAKSSSRTITQAVDVLAGAVDGKEIEYEITGKDSLNVQFTKTVSTVVKQ